MFEAAKRWDAVKVSQLAGETPDLVNATDARGRTALHLCAGQPVKDENDPATASIETAKALIRAGAKINAIHEIPDDGDIFPATPLWHAVARGKNLPLVKALLGAGANPDNCLWASVWANDARLVKVLLKAGARTELKFDGETPLLYAARLGRELVIPDLLRANASVKTKDSKGMTPLDYALKKRLSDAVIVALGGTPPVRRVGRSNKQSA